MKRSEWLSAALDGAIDALIVAVCFAIAFTGCVPRARTEVSQPAPVARTEAPDTVEPVIRDIGIDSTFAARFADYRLRRFNHKTEPDLEAIDCLYGLIRNDTAFVIFSRPGEVVEATATRVMFNPCPAPKKDIFGPIILLGMWHLHVGGIDCGFSQPDNNSFYNDKRLRIDIVSCSEGMIARWK